MSPFPRDSDGRDSTATSQSLLKQLHSNDPGAWDRSVAAFRADLRAMKDLVSDPKTDLFAPIPQGQGQTILREALLVADHNAYHFGQLVVLRRLLGAWADGA